MKNERMEVGIVGTGAVASALYRGLGRGAEKSRVRVYGRNALRAKALAGENAVDDLAGLEGCQIIVVAVSDSDVEDVVDRVAGILRVPALIVHTSGALGSSSRPESDHSFGSVHPLVAVTYDAAPGVFDQQPFAVEGGVLAETFVRRLGGVPISLPEDRVGDDDRSTVKARYHALATMVASGVVSLVARAAREMGDVGGDEDAFRRAYASLAASAAENVTRSPGPEVLTGAVARGDEDLIALHRTALESSGAAGLYDAVIAEARRMLERGPS